ncbi:gliding motility-associated ABC transporter substrate-binding protein GldG [Christiangramia forsetii]|uniref:Gliding motility protein GldG n=2 Tax=Christiangramia forsetii TaxID=411153 RepID=A0M2N3_CHRFK|nr:gliding motility-associated ABC transporter substrate-binding protein GldG [Christiangramia forsetii]GGG44095.1 gliding motility-associated ABC transporter substrate-binding protein GldG [Christiangramia forsetii]CAL66878.1 gliding motility protein GldG [Christiangramia forsetii KT0803]
MKKPKKIKSILILLVILVAANFLASEFYLRFDLTQDQRYSLSPAAKEIVADVKQPVIFDVFLEGNFPSEFRRLQNETRQMLEEFSAYNRNIKVNFVDPLAEGGDAHAIAEEFYKMGMTPARLNVQENGKNSESIIFPWAIANYGDKTIKIPLLKNQIGATDEERVNASVQQLEYVFADGLSKLIYPREKKIAVMRGNGELPDSQIADFVKTIQEYYFMAPFTLDSAATNPEKTMADLKEYDLILEPKPTQAYSENEKYILDQYLMHGGKMLWLAEVTNMETDSLFNNRGAAIALPRNLNLGDYFFSYGIRINPELINDLYSAPIILASGSGQNTRFNPYPWFYSPLTSSPNEHPIINNIEAVKFEYANPIDTLTNNIEKTILLSSSPRTRLEGVPAQISLDMVGEKPDVSLYNSGEQPLVVLLEGEFTSVYKNRVKPFKISNHRDKGVDSKMLVVSDGDVIKNDIRDGKAMELGFQRYTGNTYGNKEFLLNAVNYLLDDTGLIDIRSKKIKLAFLDKEKAAAQREQWQLINLAGPIILLLIFGIAFRYYRKQKYVK